MYSVLVVDDEIRQREAVIKSVNWEKAGFKVVGDAENGIEALELLEKLEPDLILTDIKMPLMTGLELARKAREIRPATKLVILSGYDDFEYAQEAFKYNVIRYLLKPISASEISEEFVKIKVEMDEEFERLKTGTSNEETELRLKKTEFLLPLLLGTGEDIYTPQELKDSAKRLGLIKSDNDCYSVVVSKFKTFSGENCTEAHHIDFVNSIVGKYANCESFFVNGRIVTLVTSEAEEMSTKLRLPVIELVQSAKKLFDQKCTIGISQTVESPVLLSLACAQAITARRYTSDGAGDIRFINDQERKSIYELEDIEKSVHKLEQLLKIGNKEEISEFLNDMLSNKNRDEINYLIIQILATAHRCVSVLSDNDALSELFSSNNPFTSRLSFDFNEQYKKELISLCLDARDIISRSQRQMVEIAKAVSYNSKIIVFDEPTSSLTEEEVEHLFRIINMLRDRGCGIIYISHKMEEILRISDDVTIMRDGKWIATKAASELTMDEIIKLMVGRELTNRYPEKDNKIGDVLLNVENLSGEYTNLNNVSFQARRGEILGVAGLDGSGRTELLEQIFGITTKKSGKITLDGKEVKNRNPHESIKNGFALLTEERRATGIFGILNIRENTTISSLKKYQTGPFLNKKKMKDTTDEYIKSLRVKTPNQETKISSLSGGNQQKVILARWLLTEPTVLLLDEPTRGIDVGAKYEIYQLILDLAKKGKTVIMVSSEMAELLGVCDKILVMSGGRLSGEVDAKTTNQEEIMTLAAKYV